jgi:hypothetical protein
MRRNRSSSPIVIVPDGQLRILMMLDGKGKAEEGGTSRPFPLGQTLLLPATADTMTISADVKLTVLEALVS